MRPLRAYTLAAALVAGPAALTGNPVHAEPAAAVASPPFDLADPQRALAGKKRFGANCAAYCHGNEGSGGRTPPFKGNKNFSAADAFKTITEGRRASDIMPPWGKAFTPEEIWELVAYLDQLSKLPSDN